MAEEPRTPEGRLVAQAIEDSGRSVRNVAASLPISDTRLRQWIAGFDRNGEVQLPRRHLANLALELGIPRDQIDAIRPDAAALIPETVGGDTDTAADDVRYRKPQGMSDERWQVIRARIDGYVQAQLDQAATER